MTTQVSLRVNGPESAPTGSPVTYRVTLSPSPGPSGTIFATLGTGLSRNSDEERRDVVNGKVVGPPLTFITKWVGINHLRVAFAPPAGSLTYSTASGGMDTTVTLYGPSKPAIGGRRPL